VDIPFQAIPFQAIAEFTYDWESWLDANGHVRWVNPAITRLTGYSVAEGLSLEDYPLPLVVPADRPVMRAVLERALRGESGNHVEFRVLQKDGTERYAAISWQPLRGSNDEALGVRTSVRDIDLHKQLEKQLEAALRRAEAANVAKVEFLANVSHELRTPLVSILGYTELLRASSTDPKLKRYLATIASQGQQLERLVSDLLDFGALGAGSLPLRPAPVRPDEVVREAVRALLPHAQEKGLDLRHDIERCPLVSLDAARLTQVVSSLIDNAIKYTTSGHVAVRSRRDEVTGNLSVEVEDTGPGFPAGLNLFEPFRQGGGGQGGVGLGLAIAQRLCRAMGGDLILARTSGPGACLRATFQAPVAAPALTDVTPQEEDVDARPELTASTFPLDVLVVDDVPWAREFLADALRCLGYQPRTCSTGAEAIGAASERPPDVTFIDLQMPGQDGWSVARELRRVLGPGHILVGASASHLLADSPGLAAAGFDAFLPKPTPLAELERLLRKAATQRRLGTGTESEPAPPDRPQIELGRDRLAELAALRTPDGTALLTRTFERLRADLPALGRRVREAGHGAGDLCRAVHDLAGVFALVGLQDGRTLALDLEERMRAAQPSEAEISTLLDLVEGLRARIIDELRQPAKTP